MANDIAEIGYRWVLAYGWSATLAGLVNFAVLGGLLMTPRGRRTAVGT